jgi:integrase
MASIVKKPNSRYFHAVFRDGTGKQRVKTTKETRRSIARKIAETFETIARRKTSWPKLWESLKQLHALISGEELHGATVQEFCAQWLKNKKGNRVTLSTEATYTTLVKQFLAFLGPKRAAAPLADITKTDLNVFRNSLVEEGLSPASVKIKVTILRMIFAEARRDGFVAEDPAENLKTLKDKSKRVRRPLTVQEIQQVLAIADPEWQSLIRFGLYTGQRLGDLALLRWENIDLIGGRLFLKSRKTGQNVQLPITGALREHILTLDSSDDPKTPLHPRAYALVESQQGRVVSLSNQFVALLVQAGLRTGHTHKANGKGRSAPRTRSELSFHSLRHTAVSLLKNAGVPHAVAQAFIGHQSQEISQLYTHVGEESLAGALRKFPAV